jgi:hypothetical protein
MELTSLDVSAGQAGGASAPTGSLSSLANIDDDDDEEPATVEASTAPTTTGGSGSEDGSPSASGEWEDVEERS